MTVEYMIIPAAGPNLQQLLNAAAADDWVIDHVLPPFPTTAAPRIVLVRPDSGVSSADAYLRDLLAKHAGGSPPG